MPEYFPSTQSSHVPPAGPKCPAVQRHAVMTVLSARDSDLAGQPVHCVAASALNVFAAQSSHAAAPVAPLALPASHPAQTSPSGPVYPALHRQSVSNVLASATVQASLGQLSQAVAPVVSM